MGVLFCDVLTLGLEAKPQENLQAIPVLGYVPLPEDLRAPAIVRGGDARLFRDIAVLDGHLKTKKILGVALFTARRVLMYDFTTYMHTKAIQAFQVQKGDSEAALGDGVSGIRKQDEDETQSTRASS
jgi:hypothetical protein